MKYKLYPIYMKQGLFRKKLIGHAEVVEEITKQGDALYPYDEIKITYLDFKFFPFFDNLMYKIKHKGKRFAKQNNGVKEK